MIATLTLSEALDAFFQREPSLLADPYPLYARLRAEDPVHRRESTMTFFILTRYADVASVLRDQRFSSDRNYGGRVTAFMDCLLEPERTWGLEVQRFLGLTVLCTDPPDHSRLRGLMHRAFTPRIVETMRDRIRRLVDDALDVFVPTGSFDVMGGLAYCLPATVILELFGVPLADRGQLQHWCDDIGVFFDGMRGIELAHRSMLEFYAYLRSLIEERRARPGEDLLSALVMAEAHGDRLSEEELFANTLGLIFAGHKTMTNLIGNGLLALLRHPDQLALLREDSALIAPAVEELLRYDTPDQATLRIATADCEIGGKRISAGQGVSLWIGAANRDPARFSDPDRLDVTRQNNPHLAFAPGTHYCLGSVLARMEAQIVIGSVLRRLPNLHLATESIAWENNLSQRGVKALPVTFTPGSI